MYTYILTKEALYNDKLEVIEIAADMIDIVEGSLIFFEFLESDGSYDIIGAFAPDIWKQCIRKDE